MNKHTFTMLALAMGASSLCQAAEVTSAPQASTSYDLCKSIGDHLKLFDAKRDHAENPWIQEASLKFRAQYQFSYLQPAGGTDRVAGTPGHDRRTNSEWRRFRIGGQAKVLNHFTLFANWNIGGLETRDTFSNGAWKQGRTSSTIDEIFLSGTFKPVTFTLGKHKPAFMGEYRTSSAKIITIERSFLVNQLKAEKLYGLSFKNSDSKAKWGWELGMWMNGSHDGMWMEPAFNSDSSAMLGASLNYATSDKSRLYLDYMHSFADWEDVSKAEDEGIAYDGTSSRDVVALTWEAKKDKLTFMAEAIGAFNLNMPEAENAFGLALVPRYRISPHWEGVFRYQVASGSNAINSDSRYYTTNSTYKNGCDLTQGFYFGVNYYVSPENPHAMKLMLGAEYLNSHGLTSSGQKGFTGWGFTTAARVNF